MPNPTAQQGLNVLLVLPNLSGGGAEGAYFRYITALKRFGHDVELVLLEDKATYPPPTNCRVTLIRRSLFGTSPLGIASSARRLARWHQQAETRRPFDLVISTLPTADAVVARAGLPDAHCRIANTLSASLDRVAERDPKLAATRRAALVGLYGPRSLIAVSDGVAADLRAMLGPDAAVRTIHNPFDLDRVRVLASAPDAGLPDEPYILHAGRFAPQKRHDLLLDAYAGSGVAQRLVLLTEPEPALDRLIERHRLTGRVVVAGFKTNPFPWYARASAVVLSSDHEGMPNVLIEAIACGTPVVSTDCPSGPSELLTGPLRPFLVPRRDPLALADAIRRVVAAPPAVDPARVARFSERAFVDAVVALAAETRSRSVVRRGGAP